MNMRIVYCIESLYKPGGMERVLTTKANYLADVIGHDVSIIIYDNGDGCAPFFPLSKKINVYRISHTSPKQFRSKLEKFLMKLSPDVTISLCGPEFGFLYKIKDGSKKIVEFHFTYNYLTQLVKGIKKLRFRHLHLIKVSIYQLIQRHNITKYDKVVLLTERDLKLWGNKKNMLYIHNPLSFQSNEVSNCTNTKIIACGRFIAQKGFDLLINAFRKIASDFPNWQIDIYGEGQDKDLLEHMIDQYELSSQIKLHPPVKDIKNKLLEASIFVFPSRYEGFGLVLTEAMECGLPCVSFDCDCGPSEIVSHNETGFLVETGNTTAFANSLRILMSDEQLRKRMSENARKKVKLFYVENIMAKWDVFFRNITNK